MRNREMKPRTEAFIIVNALISTDFCKKYHLDAIYINRRKKLWWILILGFQTLNVTPSWIVLRFKSWQGYVTVKMGPQTKVHRCYNDNNFGKFCEKNHIDAIWSNRRKRMCWIRISCFHNLIVTPSWVYRLLKSRHGYVTVKMGPLTKVHRCYNGNNFGKFCEKNHFDAIWSNRRKRMCWIQISCFQSLIVIPSLCFLRSTLCTFSIIRIWIRASTKRESIHKESHLGVENTVSYSAQLLTSIFH